MHPWSVPWAMCVARGQMPSGHEPVPQSWPQHTGSEHHRALGRSLAAKYGGARKTPPTLQAIEKAFDAFRAAPPAEREPARDALDGLGVVLGDHLAAIPGLVWIVVKDDEGSDPAIYGQAGELLIYPTTYVHTHFENGEPLGAREMVADVEKRWKALTEAWEDD